MASQSFINKLRNLYHAVAPLKMRLKLRDARYRLMGKSLPEQSTTSKTTAAPSAETVLQQQAKLSQSLDFLITTVQRQETAIAELTSQINTINWRISQPRLRQAITVQGEKDLTIIPDHIKSLLAQMANFPDDWHVAGSFHISVLTAIAYHCATLPFPILHSAETGCGKSTILLSHISQHHTVFSFSNDYGFTKAADSQILKSEAVEFVEGPTQKTLPQYQFTHKLHVAIIDGPHGYPFPDLEYYYFYPQLEPGALLVIDDIQIPSIRNMFDIIATDKMFTLIDVIATTAFFRRTAAPIFDPFGDGWFLQRYNAEALPDDLRHLADT